MARIRSVHPGLFTDEAFMQLTVDCPTAIPLLIGLWCDADDGGVFEWKPIVLKARYLAAMAQTIGPLLAQLEALNFIRCFIVEGRALGVVRNFRKFQRPKTPQMKLPATREMRVYAGSDVEAAEPISFPQKGEIEAAQVVSFPPKGEIDPQMKEEEEGGKESSSSRARANATPSKNPPDKPATPALEAEARAIMSGLPVVVDADFSPVAALLDEPGLERIDVVVGLTDAAAAPGFRPVSWRQCAGWVRRAGKNRIAVTQGARPRAPPRSARSSDLSVCLEMMRDDAACPTPETGFPDGERARAGPVIEGVAVAQ